MICLPGRLTFLVVAFFWVGHGCLAYTFAGNGTDSCGRWTAERREGGSSAQQWVLGYMAGVATATDADPMSSTDAYGVWAWIDRYCYLNPTDQLITASLKFVNDRIAHGK